MKRTVRQSLFLKEGKKRRLPSRMAETEQKVLINRVEKGEGLRCVQRLAATKQIGNKGKVTIDTWREETAQIKVATAGTEEEIIPKLKCEGRVPKRDSRKQERRGKERRGARMLRVGQKKRKDIVVKKGGFDEAKRTKMR